MKTSHKIVIPLPRFLASSVWLLVALTGCSSEVEPKKTADPSLGAPPPQTTSLRSQAVVPRESAAPPVTEVALQEADAEAYQLVLTAAKGDVILVDFWATWCVPCKKNLPKVVGYRREYADQGFTVVTVSIDDPDAHDKALTFLTSLDAKVFNLRSKWGSGTESAERFEFSGEVPHYKLYDRQGKLRYQFSASADIDDTVEPIDDLKKRIEELLSEA